MSGFAYRVTVPVQLPGVSPVTTLSPVFFSRAVGMKGDLLRFLLLVLHQGAVPFVRACGRTCQLSSLPSDFLEQKANPYRCCDVERWN
eukprot:2119434-Amphidinium_carterae.2